MHLRISTDDPLETPGDRPAGGSMRGALVRLAVALLLLAAGFAALRFWPERPLRRLERELLSGPVESPGPRGTVSAGLVDPGMGGASTTGVVLCLPGGPQA